MTRKTRTPRDVVGDDPELLAFWDCMPGVAQLNLLKSGITVSTLGELKQLAAHFAPGSGGTTS